MPKKKPPATKPAPLRWTFAPDVPTHDFFEEGPLDEMGNLQEAVDNFVYRLEDDSFLTWEAVFAQEQGLPLTPRQQEVLDDLLIFGDEDDRILYINEIPRPSEPWHVILNKIAPHLLVEPFRTSDSHYDVQHEGWNQIVTALREHGHDLSLPPGAESPEEVVPADLRHKLCLQTCFDPLSGLGQEDDLTLENPDEHDRIARFINRLREHKPTVAHFHLEAVFDAHRDAGKPGTGVATSGERLLL